jgi:hypothetical protein
MTIPFDHVDNPTSVDVFVARTAASPAADRLLICSGTAVFLASSDDNTKDLVDTLEFPLPKDTTTNVIIGQNENLVNSTVTASLADLDNNGTDNGRWSIDFAQIQQPGNPNPDGNFPVQVEAQVHIHGAGGIHIRRMAYQAALLIKNSTPTLSSFGLDPERVARGGISVGTVALSGPAPTGGVVVNLASANPRLVSVPPSITVGEGQTTATFGASTQPVANLPSQVDRSDDISASFAAATKTATLTIVREIF